MTYAYRYLFPALWLGWMGYWWAASFNVKTAARHETLPSRLAHIVPLMLAFLLLFPERSLIPALGQRFMPYFAAAFWVGAALTLAGLLFTVWARVHIGRNWSGTVTVKHDHDLITSGPYRYVRHPIYSGLVLAFVGSALARGEWRGVVALALVVGSFWRKLRLEERWMREQFGSAYEEYSRRVAALIPFVL
ncbi:MAG TPA: isoprenylcysteine carboxylmethyltransferase family protein [Steroidobacteraceae bacterium]|jgi:protein-S-isoprenylcysteine O-methyltransferase Ste14